MSDLAKKIVDGIIDPEGLDIRPGVARFAAISVLCDLASEARSRESETITLADLNALIDQVHRAGHSGNALSDLQVLLAEIAGADTGAATPES
jgi:hypothetical protein